MRMQSCEPLLLNPQVRTQAVKIPQASSVVVVRAPHGATMEPTVRTVRRVRGQRRLQRRRWQRDCRLPLGHCPRKPLPLAHALPELCQQSSAARYAEITHQAKRIPLAVDAIARLLGATVHST